MITKERVEEARKSLKEMYLQYYKDNFGIDIGTVVVCRDKTSKKNGCDCLVTRIETDLSYLSYPKFFAKPKNKDGEWSKSELSFFLKETWELKS